MSSSPSAPKKRASLEKAMALLALVFVLGVILMTVLPEPWSGASSGLVLLGALWAMFKA